MHSWASLWIFEFCIAPPTYAKAIFATQPQYISVASYINWKTNIDRGCYCCTWSCLYDAYSLNKAASVRISSHFRRKTNVSRGLLKKRRKWQQYFWKGLDFFNLLHKVALKRVSTKCITIARPFPVKYR